MRTILGMASITIRNLDDETTRRLRIRAAKQNRSMEEEEPSVNLAERIRRMFETMDGIDIFILSRDSIRKPPEF